MTPQEIEALRATLCLTVSEFCRRLGATSRSYGYWIAGTHTPHPSKVRQMRRMRRKARHAAEEG